MRSRSNAKGVRPGSGPVTLAMVAELAGVSASTVSRILNGSAVVSAEKRQAIDDAIAKLGFVPNPVARGLAGGRTLSVGVITQALDSPFYGATLRGIELELQVAGYSALFVSGHWNATEEARCIDVLRARRVDGIIVLTGRLSDSKLKECAKTIPIVVTGRNLKASQLYAFNFDQHEGARLATKHLVDLGHKRIAFITGDMEHPDARERERGYRAALNDARIPFDKRLIVNGLYTEDSGMTAAAELLSRRRPFTAVFAANDQMALGAALCFHRQGLHIPGDVALVGFDDLPVCSYSYPPLSSIHHPANEMGRLAASAMLQLLQGLKPVIAIPPPTLKIRQSTEASAS